MYTSQSENRRNRTPKVPLAFLYAHHREVMFGLSFEELRKRAENSHGGEDEAVSQALGWLKKSK